MMKISTLMRYKTRIVSIVVAVVTIAHLAYYLHNKEHGTLKAWITETMNNRNRVQQGQLKELEIKFQERCMRVLEEQMSDRDSLLKHIGGQPNKRVGELEKLNAQLQQKLSTEKKSIEDLQKVNDALQQKAEKAKKTNMNEALLENYRMLELNSARLKDDSTEIVIEMLLWTPFFGAKNWNHWPENDNTPSKSYHCGGGVTCLVSSRQADVNPLKYDGLIFHARDLHINDKPHLRKKDQLYIIYTAESQISQERYAPNHVVKGGDFYNLTWTWKRDADIMLKWGYWVDKSVAHKLSLTVPDPLYANKVLHKPGVTADQPIKFEQQTLTNMEIGMLADMLPAYSTGHPGVWKHYEPDTPRIAWIVSNCKKDRIEAVKRLQQHIPVDIYGGCGMPCPKSANTPGLNDCFRNLGLDGKYMFYLAFENEGCDEYVSEKPWNALNNYMIPIVAGGLKKEDYEYRLPPKSYVATLDYDSPAKLAEYLRKVMSDERLYLLYHRWRLTYVTRNGSNDVCAPCREIGRLKKQQQKTKKKQSKSVDFEKYFDQKQCDLTFYDKLWAPKTTPSMIRANTVK